MVFIYKIKVLMCMFVCIKLFRPKPDLPDCLLWPCIKGLTIISIFVYTNDVGMNQISVAMNTTPTNVSPQIYTYPQSLMSCGLI